MNVLNYVATSNHIHLLVYAGDDRHAIPRAMQLLAGRVGQDYNVRKGRCGAFWEDRYHATAVETGRHLRRCMTYIDLNMVRCGVVRHPKEWDCCGYREIQEQPKRYARIDRELLSSLLELPGPDAVAAWQEESVQQALQSNSSRLTTHCPEWTRSIAVGSEAYVGRVKDELGIRGCHRDVKPVDGEDDGACMLCEPSVLYRLNNEPESAALSVDNTVLWRLFL